MESIMTASAACGGRRRAAAASMGSDMMRKAAAVEAAAERCKKERREKRGMRDPLGEGVYQRTAARRSYITDCEFVMERVRRQMGGAEPPRPQFAPGDPTGVHRFARE